MPGEKKRVKYWNLSMDDLNTDSVDTEDTDVLELYRKGPEDYRCLDDNESERRVDETRAVALAYEKLSEKEAAILRRLLRSGRPVEELCLHDISLCAFRLAFDNLEQCPSLSSLYIHVDLQGKELGRRFSAVFTSLQSLELSCDNTGSRFVYHIASYMRQNKTLRELRLCNSCGGDEGAAVLIEALAENNTLKLFALNDIKSSSDTLVGFAKMLATNRTLEMVHLGEVRCGEVVKVWSLLAQERYAGVFQRLQVVWPDELLSLLTVLIRREVCAPTVSAGVTSSIDEGVLREFFDAVAENKTLRRLYFDSEVFDALANGIAFVVKSTRTLWEIHVTMEAQRGSEYQLITILNALKENSSITHFAMCIEMVTPEVSTSLAELLAANKALTDIYLCEESNISPTAGQTILQGLRANYTLTELGVCSKFDENNTTRDIEALLKRNFRILEQAADFVISGGDVSDQVGPYALKKVHSWLCRDVEVQNREDNGGDATRHTGSFSSRDCVISAFQNKAYFDFQ
ncbi:hypothetical protein HPB52_014757 [Rhipicephalus sanguineus]|uniref:Uncharacterized protein n=1 Tax=Rhipicephalus sanguineus TaxID=34632 RepID=A0A9D4QEV3_RHISA|nr:hypothetical protein HPB52_014757 [Rhipicephalus sanguineus]